MKTKALLGRLEVWWFFRWIRLHYLLRIATTWWWTGMTWAEAREDAAAALLLDLRQAGLDPWKNKGGGAP